MANKPKPQPPGSISVGKVADSTGVTIGHESSTTVIQTGGPPSESRAGRRRISWRRVAIGLMLMIVAFFVSLWLYPAEWGQSWKTVFALGIAAVVGVTLLLDAARNAYEQ